ncbi:hypothetical protein [Microbacterium timonense]|jgi:hypothetical protein|uniref:hypothetical protein n=1 Tax=Microbacterium timonense TaxID=2086576 RepID=UPI000D0F6694|nr:hypothetical protein [Microbacterium timonense]
MTMVEGVAARVLAGGTHAVWHEVDTGFWVGNAGGAFLGSIERLGRGRYLARDELHRIVGEYVGLAGARDAIVKRINME